MRFGDFVVLYMIDLIPEVLKHLHPEWNDAQINEVDRKLNDRLRQMPRAEDFQLPGRGSGYFFEHSRIQAKEHKNIMQVRVLPARELLHGVS